MIHLRVFIIICGDCNLTHSAAFCAFVILFLIHSMTGDIKDSAQSIVKSFEIVVNLVQNLLGVNPVAIDGLAPN